MATKRQRLHKFRKRLVHPFLHKAGQPKSLFIGGEQRSGTNFLIDVIDRCKESECYLESDEEAFNHYVLRERSNTRHLIEKSKARVVAFKSICDSQNIGALLKEMPNAYAIWTFRRYEDVINSSLRNFSGHNKHLYYMLHEPQKAGWRVENVTEEELELVRYYYEKGVDDASARALIWYLRNILFFQQGLDSNKNVIMTRYEDIATSPEKEFEKVFRFLGLPNNRKAARIAFASSLHKNDPPRIDPGIEKLCQSLYERLNACYQAQPG